LIQSQSLGRLHDPEESRKSLKRVEEGGRRHPEDGGGREDQLMPNGSKYHRTEANMYSIECRNGGEAGGCSGFEGQRSHKAERAIGRKSGWF
jgi:hypothetical protein